MSKCSELRNWKTKPRTFRRDEGAAKAFSQTRTSLFLIYEHCDTLGYKSSESQSSLLLKQCLSSLYSRQFKSALPETLLEGIQNTAAKWIHPTIWVTGKSPHFPPQQLLIYLCFKLKKWDLNHRKYLGSAALFPCPWFPFHQSLWIPVTGSYSPVTPLRVQ